VRHDEPGALHASSRFGSHATAPSTCGAPALDAGVDEEHAPRAHVGTSRATTKDNGERDMKLASCIACAQRKKGGIWAAPRQELRSGPSDREAVASTWHKPAHGPREGSACKPPGTQGIRRARAPARDVRSRRSTMARIRSISTASLQATGCSLLAAILPLALIASGCGTTAGGDAGTASGDTGVNSGSSSGESTGAGSGSTAGKSGSGASGASGSSSGGTGQAGSTGSSSGSAPTDAAATDAVGPSCEVAGDACCPGGALGGPGTTDVSPYCTGSLQCCMGSMTCAVTCSTADASLDSSTTVPVACGSKDDAGVAHSGVCPAGQFCCYQGHTGVPPSYGCREADAACVPLP
jgi:hypothetical protein